MRGRWGVCASDRDDVCHQEALCTWHQLATYQQKNPPRILLAKRSLYRIFTYLYHDRSPSTMYRTTCRYLSAPTRVGPGIVNENALGCLGTVLICSLRLSVTTENLGDHAHGRLWVESQRAGDVENTVFCNLQYAMPNVEMISLLTQPSSQIASSNTN